MDDNVCPWCGDAHASTGRAALKCGAEIRGAGWTGNTTEGRQGYVDAITYGMLSPPGSLGPGCRRIGGKDHRWD